MTDLELKQQLVDAVTELFHAGLITGKGGNVSVRSVERNDAVWITPSQIFKGALKADQMILIDMEGKRIEGATVPSVESSYHAGIMKLRPEINSVVHTHAPLATIFGMTEMQLLPITSEAVMIMNFPKLPFYIGGSRELSNVVLENVGKTKVMGAFLQNHGLITIGKDMGKATELTNTAEFVVKMLLIMRGLDLKPSVLPENAVNLLSKFIGII